MNNERMSWEEAVQWLREQPDQQPLVRACYYDDPVERAAERFAASEEWQAVIELLSPAPGSRVLDLGAGRGISSYGFAKAGCVVTALEPDRSPLVGSGAVRELFARTGLPVTIIEKKGERLPFPDASFDIVYGRAVLHHAEDLRSFCAEARRVLSPGGRFLVTREHVISRRKDLQAFLDAHPLHHLYGGEHAYLLREYLDAIASSGLQIRKVFGPHESSINLAPMTVRELQEMIERMHARFLGARMGRLVAGVPFYKTWFIRWLTWRTDHPGRLYTFLVMKDRR